jgi:hypothetical protein
MGRKMSFVGVMAAAFIALGSVSAFASQEGANGTGTTAAGAHFGFNAQEDLGGSFEYQAADGSLNIHCNDFMMYMGLKTPRGFPKAWFSSSNCFDKAGVQYHLQADLIDRGEGANDLQDGGWISFRNLSTGKRMVDRGHIQNGNIQVHY